VNSADTLVKKWFTTNQCAFSFWSRETSALLFCYLFQRARIRFKLLVSASSQYTINRYTNKEYIYRNYFYIPQFTFLLRYSPFSYENLCERKQILNYNLFFPRFYIFSSKVFNFKILILSFFNKFLFLNYYILLDYLFYVLHDFVKLYLQMS